MIYPRKRPVPLSQREGAFPNTLFVVSDSGWVTSELFLEWFNFFLQNIPPARPVLLPQDGHGVHVSIELIELAHANDVHLLCLPAHTSHLLQPLDVGVFKSFKSNFNKACSNYMSKNPGRVVTEDLIASLVSEAYVASFTPIYIMKGFKKTGVWPINPGEVTDRQFAPAKAFNHADYIQRSTPEPKTTTDKQLQGSPLFSPESEALYQKRYEEKCDLKDAGYIAWLKINHPELNVSDVALSDSSSGQLSSERSKASSDVFSDLLVLPEGKHFKRRGGINSRVVCITESQVLEELKAKKEKKKFDEQLKAERKMERERKKLEKEEKKKEKARQRIEKKIRDKHKRKVVPRHLH